MSMSSCVVKRISALATVFVALLGNTAFAQDKLQTFVVGKWRLPTAAGYNEAVFTPGGFFKITIFQRGVREQAYISGSWQVQGGQVVSHNMSWYPIYVRHPNGLRTKLQIPAWESTHVEIIDANHFRSESGVATRVVETKLAGQSR